MRMKNKKIQQLRAQWFSFKTNRFYVSGIRSGIKRGLVAGVLYVLFLNPLIWIVFDHLNTAEAEIPQFFIVLSTIFLFGAIAIPAFTFIGIGLGFAVAKTLESKSINWKKTQFIWRCTSIASMIGLFITAIGALFIFDISISEHLFNFILMWLTPILTLIGLVFHLAFLMYNRMVIGEL